MITLPPPEVDLPAEHLLRQLLDALAAHPEVREPLLRVLLTEDFLALPERVSHLQATLDDFREEMRSEIRRVDTRIDENTRQISENTRQTQEHTRQIQEHTRQISEHTAQIQENTRQISENTRQISENTRQISENTEQLRENTRQLRRLSGHVGRLRGAEYEDGCRRRIGIILDGLVERPGLADWDFINEHLRELRHRGLITRAEYDDGMRADIIAWSADDAGQPGQLFVGEASITFNRGDLETAARRAGIIGRATGVPTVAFLVTHYGWPDEASEVARQLGVTIIRHESDQHADDVDE